MVPVGSFEASEDHWSMMSELSICFRVQGSGFRVGGRGQRGPLVDDQRVVDLRSAVPIRLSGVG